MSQTPENTPQGPTDVAALPLEEKIALTGGSDAWHTHGVPSLGLDPIMVSDGPHGLRTQHGVGDNLGLNESVPATCFPPAVGLSATWSRSAAASVARAIGEEALAEGVSVVLGPGMNIKRSPLCGRNFEYFSEDPHLAGEIAVAYTNAIQELGVGVSIKHFALNNQETDRMRVDVTVDERTMHEIYLRAFRSVVTRARPWTVMCSYNSVGGTLMSQNHRLLTEILRDQWGFDGMVMSDWGAVVDRPAAIEAGLDLQMPADSFAEEDLRRAVAAGTVDPSALDRAAGRTIDLLRKGLAHRDPEASYDVDGHHQVALEVARKALVLLHNDGILPLDEEDGGDLAVIGDFARTPRYQGAGSSHVNATRVDTALDAIRAIAGDVPFARGFAPGGDDGAAGDDGADQARVLREEAVEVARAAGTVVVFLGLGEDVESEGYDRTDMELPATQVELLRAVREVNENVVVVLSNGSAIRLPEDVRGASAVLEGWLLGQAGGQATADVLFGRANPSGKLAESIPLQLADTPSYLHFPGDHSRVTYGEGIFVGYRGLDAVGREVAYPFGHGLSYTTFEYSDLAVSPGTGAAEGGLDVEVTITNTGDIAGREVVQAYVGVPDSKVARPVRELKGFEEVELEAGQWERVHITIPATELQYFSIDAGGEDGGSTGVEDGTGDWVVEPGRYHVEVGASSRDLRGAADVDIAGSEPAPRATFDSTPLEIMAMPGGAEAIGALLGTSQMATDPEMLKMAEQIPVGRFTGIGGMTREQVQQFLDAVNAGV
jgi:beta-glucosidase